MAGVLRTPMVYTEIQYDGETEKQYRRRCKRIREQNAEADRIEAAWVPSPMKGLREGWDCGCWFSCGILGRTPHPFCPRRE